MIHYPVVIRLRLGVFTPNRLEGLKPAYTSETQNSQRERGHFDRTLMGCETVTCSILPWLERRVSHESGLAEIYQQWHFGSLEDLLFLPPAFQDTGFSGGFV